MRLSASPLLLAGLLSQSIHAQAKDIEVCTQVTKQYVTNGDFVTDSNWTSPDDYTIITKSELEHGYMNVITDDDHVVCDLNVLALFDDDDDSEYGFITNGYLRTTAGESGWTKVLGQWKATETDITLEFKTTCTGGSKFVQLIHIYNSDNQNSHYDLVCCHSHQLSCTLPDDIHQYSDCHRGYHCCFRWSSPNGVDLYHTEAGLEPTKPTIAPYQAGTITSASHEHTNTASAVISISAETTGASYSNAIFTGTSRPDTAPTATTDEKVSMATYTNDASQANTVSADGSDSDSASNESTASGKNDSEMPQGASETPASGMTTASLFIVDSGDSKGASGASAIATSSNGATGASIVSSGPFLVSSEVSGASTSPKALSASLTLATATSASNYHSSTAIYVTPALSGAASIQVAELVLLGFITWGLAPMFP
ncbi:hypothetical protein N7451_006051 [Penicillium sp. IBT 35674x]|nr:hypothetical protein N7451_006051 [Penicillium sp. IBT 35674x]